MSQIDVAPTPSLAERIFTRAYGTNPEYTSWAQGHNAANATDRHAFDASVAAATQIGAHEAQVDARASAGDPNARRDLQVRASEEAAINKNLPPNAIPMGTQVDTGSPGGSPLRDINRVTIDNKSWGFVYRTGDGTLMLQRDAASIPQQSHTSSWGGGAAAGVGKDPFTLQVNGSYSYATTVTDPTQQAVVKLTDPDRQLPPGALVSPIRDESGVPLAGSSQLLPAKPHLNENTYDHVKPAPEKYQYDLSTWSMSAANAPGHPYASVAMSRSGEPSVSLAPDRGQVQSPGMALG